MVSKFAASLSDSNGGRRLIKSQLSTNPIRRKRRYAAGTKAGFAVNVINQKLEFGRSPALHIEAVKEGEEPVSFGPDAVLVDYGDGWKLQTVSLLDFAGDWNPERIAGVVGSEGGRPIKRISKPGISLLYIGKILLAFLLMFVLGALLTIALENLPRFILFMNPPM